MPARGRWTRTSVPSWSGFGAAVKAAELAEDQYSAGAGMTCFANDTIGVARARVPFDSFSAAPLLGRLCAPLVLADPDKIPDDTAAFLDGARDQHDAVGLQVFGGDAAVSQAAIDTYLTGEEAEDATAETDDAESPLAPSGDVDSCKPRGLTDTTAGFPLLSWTESSTGTLRVAALFMDFPDAQATRSPEAEGEIGLPVMEDYLEAASYGELDIEVVPHYHWLRADHPSSEYVEHRAYGSGLDERAGAHAVALVDADVDFSNINSVMVVFPGEYFANSGNAGGTATADGNTMNFFRVNTKRLQPGFHEQSEWVQRANSEWGILAAHELAHNLGLLDLYPFDASAHARPAALSNKEWIPVEIGLMDLHGYFLADASEMLRQIRTSYPDGYTYWWDAYALQLLEMLAWSRFQLGWLGDEQVWCVDNGEASVALAPVAQPGGRAAVAVVPLNGREVIVVESRRNLGYDRGTPLTWPRGDTTNRRALLHEGVLVYTVDASVPSGQLPMRIAGDKGDGQVAGFPVIGVGESVTLHGYTITVTADDGSTHTVSITRNS